jgi:hypothetical protein
MLALLLFGAIVLRDDVVRIPPHHKWRYDRFIITEKNLPVTLKCSFRVKSGDNVRVELISDADLEALRAGRNYDVIQSSSTGDLDHEIGIPGTFDLVLWNDDDSRAADVALKMALDFNGGVGQARTLSRQCQITVIALSIAGFLTILGVSIRQLLKAMAAPTSFQIPDEPESIPPTPGPDPD